MLSCICDVSYNDFECFTRLKIKDTSLLIHRIFLVHKKFRNLPSRPYMSSKIILWQMVAIESTLLHSNNIVAFYLKKHRLRFLKVKDTKEFRTLLCRLQKIILLFLHFEKNAV